MRKGIYVKAAIIKLRKKTRIREHEYDEDPLKEFNLFPGSGIKVDKLAFTENIQNVP